MAKRLVLVIAVAMAMLFCTPGMLAQGKGEPAGEKAASPAEKTTLITEKTTSITEKTKSMEKMAGYFNIYWDAKAGKLWLEIDKWGTEFLYQSSLPAAGWSKGICVGRGPVCGARVGACGPGRAGVF